MENQNMVVPVDTLFFNGTLTAESGVIIDASERTESYTSGSIDTTYKGFGAGARPFVSGSISTQVNHQQKYWIKMDDGRETWFYCTNMDLALRPGHRVTTITMDARRKIRLWGVKNEDRAVLKVINHTTSEIQNASEKTSATFGLLIVLIFALLFAMTYYSIAAVFAFGIIIGIICLIFSNMALFMTLMTGLILLILAIDVWLGFWMITGYHYSWRATIAANKFAQQLYN